MQKLFTFFLLLSVLTGRTFADSGPVKPANTFEVTNTAAGSISQAIQNMDADEIEGLVVSGPINGTDLGYLREQKGRIASLTYLDLSAVELVFDDTEYLSYSLDGGFYNHLNYSYYLSATNREEYVSSGNNLFQKNWNYYRNDLSAAFRNTFFKTVILPKSLTAVGERAFENTYGNSQLTYVGIPEVLTSVRSNAFSGCNKLENTTGINNLQEIGPWAFSAARVPIHLKFRIPLTRLGVGAFQGSNVEVAEFTLLADTLPAHLFAGSKLREVVIDGNCILLGENSLNSASLTAVQLPDDVAFIDRAFNDESPFIRNLPTEGGIKYIGKVAYKLGEQEATNVEVKERTLTLGDQLFYSSQVQSVRLPASLRHIGSSCFMYSQLSAIDLPENLLSIGNDAFSHTKIKQLTIPEQVVKLGTSIANNCDALWKLTYNAVCAMGDNFGNGEKVIGCDHLERIVVGDKVERLPGGVFTGNKSVAEVDLPASLKVIADYAFKNCVGLHSVRLPDGVQEIGESAFQYCNQLTDVHWPLSLRKLGSWAFEGCDLRAISLPEGMTEALQGNFPNLEYLYLPSTLAHREEWNRYYLPVAKHITCAAEVPPTMEWKYVDLSVVEDVKVPAASLQAYREDAEWGRFGDKLRSIEGIAPAEEATQISFAQTLNADADLADAVVGDVYITLGKEDGFDADDGSIVLNTTVTEEQAEAIGGMEPGKSDIANRFNGLVVMVNGKGCLNVNCLTLGKGQVNIKLGTEDSEAFSQTSKGVVSVPYDVAEPVCVYIYASQGVQSPPHQMRKAAAEAKENSVKIYSLGVAPDATGIEDLRDVFSATKARSLFTLNGQRTAHPSSRGIYLLKQDNRKAVKVLVQ